MTARYLTARHPHHSSFHRGIALLLIALVLAFTASAVSAHPADQYYHTHTITLTPDNVQIVWTISPGTLLSYVTWENADTNGDDLVNADEARAWTEPMLDNYLALIDGQLQTWELVEVKWPESLVNFEVGKEVIEIHLVLAWPESMPNTTQIAFYNQFEEYNSSNWFTIQTADGAKFRTPLQQNGVLTFQMVLGDAATSDTATTETAADVDPLREYWDSGTPAIGASGAQIAGVPQRRDTTTTASSRLADLVRQENLSLTFFLSAFAIAIGLGSLHALTPGHGKALVGAYLVGSRGTMKHALALGGIVTLTHTGSVLALGLITLAASHILLPTTLFPILEMVSGLLVVAMGLTLIYRRWKAWQSVRHARQRISLRDQMPEIPPELARQHASAPAPAAASGNVSSRTSGGRTATIQINQPIQVNVYNDVLPRDDFSLGGVNWRSLIALGVSGGLVPCPDAIAILLVAVAINRVLLGLSLIVAFSLGLAFILTGIGIAMVRSRRLFEGLDSLNRMIPALPLISALVVTGLGLGLTYNAASSSTLFKSQDDDDALDFTMGSGETTEASADETLTLKEAFSLDTAEIIYMDLDDTNRYQLYRKPVTGSTSTAITESTFGVWDYQLSPDLSTVAYAAPREAGGSDIWLIDADGSNPRLVLSCEDATCSRVTWSPDGQQLVYERLEVISPQSPLGVTTMWWLALDTGETGPVFRDSQLPSYSPAWSPDGQWLSYIAPGTASVQIYNLTDGTNIAIPSQTGNAAVWSPDGSALLVTEIWEDGGQYFTHLMRYDMDSGEITDMTTVDQAGDTWATWSPDGEWIAVVRRIYQGPNAATGDQVWVMRADGSDVRQLTNTSNVIHATPIWSPDSRYVTYQRYPLAGSESEPGIWLLDMVTGDLRQIAPSGNWPTWLP